MLKIEEFYRKYANTPLSMRMTPINFAKAGTTTLQQVWKRMEELERERMKIESQEKALLELSEEVLQKF